MSATKSEPVTLKLWAVEALFSQVLNALREPEVVIVGELTVTATISEFWQPVLE